MSRSVRSLAVVLALTVCSLCAPIASVAATNRTVLGSRLVNRFITEVERRDVRGLRKFLSPSFQIQRADGSRRTKGPYLRNLPTILSYKLRDLFVTSHRGVLVATYQVAANQVVEGKKLSSGYQPRISVFVLSPRGWQVVAWANFNTPA